jgi:hypothetical protein
MENILMTTVVSLDCVVGEPQLVIHLVQGDYGTRALRMIPLYGGRLINFAEAGVAAAKVVLACEGHENLLIDCETGENWAELVPTANMVSTADEWNAQLILLDENNQTLHSAPFIINVHGDVTHGDMVEHTDSRVIDAYYDAQGDLNLEMRSGETIKSSGKGYLATYVQGQLEAGNKLLTDEDRGKLDDIDDYLDQSVKTTASPTFSGLTIGEITISADGTISGATFT